MSTGASAAGGLPDAGQRPLRIAHLTRRPTHEHGGVERVVAGLAAAMAGAGPGHCITLMSAFDLSGGAEGIAGVSDVVAALRLARWISRTDSDVVFVHCPECLWLVRPLVWWARLSHRSRGRPAVVAVWHGAGLLPALVLRPPGDLLARGLAVFRYLEERGASWADRHVAVHRVVREELKQAYGFDEAGVDVVENALDPSFLATRRTGRQRSSEYDFLAVWVGQAGHRKGLDVAMAAVALARRQSRGMRLLVIGVTVGNPVDGVEWLGVVDPAEVVRHYERSDVLLFPTRYESFGLVVLEAMATGLPVIVSDAVPPGIVTDGRNGVVISGHDPADYSDALSLLQTSREMYEAMSAANLHDVRRFSMTAAGRRYLDVALEISADRASSSGCGEPADGT